MVNFAPVLYKYNSTFASRENGGAITGFIRIEDMTTEEEFKDALQECRAVFAAKLGDYSASWRILRPSSLTDQLFIKAKRIRQLETGEVAMIEEGIRPEIMALVNYGIIGLIQLQEGYVDEPDIDKDKALELYDHFAEETLKLMISKNHDYAEAWRGMRTTSYTDFILTKINRVKEIENNQGKVSVSEGIDSNYMDIINYAVFGMIKTKNS